MRALVALMMRGRSHAMTASALSAALSLVFPPLSYISGAVIGLATLKHGPREGLLVIGGSMLLAVVFSAVIAGTPAPALAFLGMNWLPAWGLAVVLRSTNAQGAALAVAAGLGVFAVLAMHVMMDNPVVWWHALLTEFFMPATQGADAQVVQQLEAWINGWAPRMTRIFGAVSVVGLMGTLLIARCWHAMLDNPGGFGREFRRLRVGRAAIGASAVIGLLSWLVDGAVGQLAADLMGPLSVMLAFQGLAVVHMLVGARNLTSGWLVALYLLLFVPPHLALPVLAVTGLVDGLMDLRARLAGKES